MSLNQTDKPVMRVLQILPALEAGGVERTTVDIVEALTSRGHVAHVLSAGGRLEKEIEEFGGQLHTSPVGSKNILTIMHIKHLIFYIFFRVAFRQPDFYITTVNKL